MKTSVLTSVLCALFSAIPTFAAVHIPQVAPNQRIYYLAPPSVRLYEELSTSQRNHLSAVRNRGTRRMKRQIARSLPKPHVLYSQNNQWKMRINKNHLITVCRQDGTDCREWLDSRLGHFQTKSLLIGENQDGLFIKNKEKMFRYYRNINKKSVIYLGNDGKVYEMRPDGTKVWLQELQ